MNHTYRSIWNEATHSWVAVAEIVSARGKRSGGVVGQVAAPTLPRWRALSLAVMLAWIGQPAWAIDVNTLPTSGQVVAGQAAINQAGNALNITQSTARAAIDWQSFNVGSAATVNFIQPSSSSVTLNRILSNDASQIYGKLNANGLVFFTNPNGMLFARGAQINVGGIVASTLNISNADFMAGKYTFANPGGGILKNESRINASGSAVFVGNQIDNTGEIYATTIALASGNRVAVDLTGDGLIRARVEDPALSSQINNSGTLDGTLAVAMTAGQAKNVLDRVVNNKGVIRATGLNMVNGEIVLQGGTVENTGTIIASGPQGGGTIKLLGDMEGGVVKVAGTLDASAPTAGNGGFVDTSAAKVLVQEGARVTTTAANGKAGTWLIDPTDFYIAATDPGNGSSYISNSTLATNLAGSSITIQTLSTGAGNGDIFVNGAVTWNAATKLTLSAHRNIEFNDDVTAQHASGQVQLEYGQAAVASGNTAKYVFNGAKINLQAGNNFFTKLGSDGAVDTWKVITALGAQGSTTQSDLQGMNGNLSGKYVLGADIDASGTSGWNSGQGFNPIGQGGFYGKFDGLGHTISNLYINLPSGLHTGLFGYVDNGALIRNVGLIGGSIRGERLAGALVGGLRNSSVSNSYADGTSVTGWASVGGLVGYTTGANTSITYSYATGNVIGVGPTSQSGDGNNLGGLVGGFENGTLSYVYATGNVTGGASGAGNHNQIGGLLGNFWSGSLSYSYATGNVVSYRANDESRVGGLIGLVWNSTTSISNSYATGNVTGSGNAVGGLIGRMGYVAAGSVSKTYATGLVSGAGAVGGLIGGIDGTGTGVAVLSYWNTQTTAQSTSAGGTGAAGLTTAQMQVSTNFTGWDFINVWNSDSGSSTPYLRSLGRPVIPCVVGTICFDNSAGDWLWSNALNWNLDRLPGSSDVVYLGLSGSNTITYAGPSTSYSIQSLQTTANNKFNLSSGWVNLSNASGTSSLLGGLQMADGTKLTTYGTLEITQPTGSMTLANVSAGTLKLTASGAVSQYAGAVLEATNLLLLGSGANYTFNNAANNIGTVAANTGALKVATIGSLTVGSVAGNNGISAVGDVALRADAAGACLYNSVSCGTVVLSSNITTTGRVDIYYNPSSYAAPSSFSTVTATSGLTGWMLVNDIGVASGGTRGLQALNNNLSGNYALGKSFDASLTSTWNGSTGFTPIGQSGFSGKFDGLGHTISGLYVNRPTVLDVGLFGRLINASVSNVSVVGGTFIGDRNIGGLAGYSNNSTITGSSSSASVSGWSWVGGLVGFMTNGGSISNSYATGNVQGLPPPTTGDGSSLGGLVGRMESGSPLIVNSYATGNVTGGSGHYWIGGLVGDAWSGTIRSSYATGNVTGNRSTNTDSKVGGLLGLQAGATIEDSFATGAVVASGHNIGGLVAHMNSGSIVRSYASGPVTSSLTGATGVGGLVGIKDSGTVTASYWNIQTSGQSSSAGGTGAVGLTSTQMQDLANFSTWSTSVWGTDSALSGPYLKWRYPTGYCAGACWDGGAGTYNWSDAANWLGDVLPTASSVVYLKLASPRTISLNGSVTIKALNSTSDNALSLLSGSSLLLNDSTLTSTLAGGLQMASDASLTSNGSLFITQPSGALTLGTVSAGTLKINASAVVTQHAGSTLTAGNLLLLGSNASYTLNNAANNIGTAAANTGAVAITNAAGLTVGTVAGVNGITSTGNVTLNATGATSDVTVNQLIKTGTYGVNVSVGNAGDVSITAGRDVVLGLSGTAIDASIGAQANGTTTGRGGDVTLTAGGAITGASSDILATVTKYQPGSTGSRGGHISLTANNGGVSIRDLKTFTYQNDSGGTIGNAGNVTVTASGNIAVGVIDTGAKGGFNNWGGTTTIGNAGNVTLTAGGSVTLNGALDALVSHGAYATSWGNGGKVVLRADSQGACLYNASGCATVNFNGNTVSTSGTGRVDIYYNPTAYNSPTNYTGIAGNFTAWMLVNDVGAESGGSRGLQAINNNLLNTYALGRDIDASATSAWNSGDGFTPIANGTTRFAGSFDGQGHTISNLTIKRPATENIGLFGATNAAMVKNVGLINANVAGLSNVGTLIGFNELGTVTNSYGTGTLTATGSNIGGLIGWSNGPISHSYAAVTVSGTGTFVGGLVGVNVNSSLTNSYATGNVTGADIVGGLVGVNWTSTLSNSYATGDVHASGLVGFHSRAGGLAGQNYASGVITNSYAFGSVTGVDSAYVGGALGWTDNTSSTTYTYWNASTNTQGVGTGAVSGATTGTLGIGSVGLSESALKQAANFSGWNFTTVWNIDGGSSTPYLRSLGRPIVSCAVGAICFDNSAGDWSWSNALNWNLDRLPGSSDVVYLGLSGSNTITYAGASTEYSIRSLQTSANNKLNLSSGWVNLSNSSGTSSLLGGLQMADGSKLTTLGTLEITQPTGTMTLANVSAGTLKLTAQGVVSQYSGAVLEAYNLLLLGNSASYTLNNSGNQILSLAANTGALNVRSTHADPLVISTVAGTSGITSTGAVTLSANGVTVNQAINTNGNHLTIGGGADPLTGYADGGVYLGANVTTGAGNVSIRGQSNAGAGVFFADGTLSSNGVVNINGVTGGPHSGVRFAGDGVRLSTETGTVTINGTVTNGTGAYAYGIMMHNGAPVIETTGTGSLTLNGTQLNAETPYNIGIGIHNGTIRSTSASNGGAINLNGSSLGDTGILIRSDQGPITISSVSGPINITASSGPYVGLQIDSYTSPNQVSISGGTGALTLTADTMTLGATAQISGTGSLTIKPYTAGTTIGLGSGAGILQLDANEWGSLQNGFSSITVGGANAGTISVNGLTFRDPLTLHAGNADADITLSGAIANEGAGTLSGSLTTIAARNITVGSGAGVTTNNQNISFQSQDLDWLGTVNAGTATVSVSTNNSAYLGTATGSGFVLGGAELGRLTAGALTLTAPGISVDGVTAANSQNMGQVNLLAGNNGLSFGATKSVFKSLDAQSTAWVNVAGDIETTVGNLVLKNHMVGGTWDDDLHLAGNAGVLNLTSAGSITLGNANGVIKSSTIGSGTENFTAVSLNAANGVTMSVTSGYGYFQGSWNIQADSNADGVGALGNTAGARIGGSALTLSGASVNLAGGATASGLINISSKTDIVLPGSATLVSTGGNILLRADSSGTGTGTVSVTDAGAIQATNGGVDIYYNPSSYGAPTDFSTKVLGSNYTAWMLVNSVADLQAIGTNWLSQSGTYALSKDLDASETAIWNSGAGFAPLTFSGRFDGMNHTITGLTINRPGEDNVGLFSTLSNGSSVSNLGLVSVSLVGGEKVAPFAGTNDGNISNSYASSGSVAGEYQLGGLVALNRGTLQNTHYDIDGLTINGGNHVTVGGLYGDRYALWQSANRAELNINTGPFATTLPKDSNDYYTVSTVQGLKDMLAFVGNPTYKFKLGADIDVASQPGWFIPVFAAAEFSGDNGNGGAFVISHVNVNQPFNSAIGVFGEVKANSAIHHVGANNVSITGGAVVGGLVGENHGSLDHSFATGVVNAPYGDAGGLVGDNWGGISNSYAATAVNSDTSAWLGGVVGWNVGTVVNTFYDFESASSKINNQQHLTHGGLYSAQFNDWLSHGKSLNIENYSSSLPSVGGYYTISTVQGLKDLLGFAGVENYKFKLAADIDVASTPGLYIPYLGAQEFNGAGHVIDHVAVHQASFGVNLGLFGLVSENSTLKNIGATNVQISGVTALGGLVGENRGVINNAYATGSVLANGLDGRNSYSVGGLVGVNSGQVTYTYSLVSVNAEDSFQVGGLVGTNNFVGAVGFSYSTGAVSGKGSVGGLVGSNHEGDVTSSFWDTETSGLLTSSLGGAGKTTAELFTRSTYDDAGWTFGDGNAWAMSEGNTRPFLRSEYQTTITNAHQLQLIGIDPTATYTLAKNIDLGAELNTHGGMWGSKGFMPIGYAGQGTPAFSGIFNGNFKTISGLTINRPTESSIGLFDTNTGSITNVGLVDANVTGNGGVAALVGTNSGNISGSYATGSVEGQFDVGGLVGRNLTSGIVASSYADVAVNVVVGYAGGLVAWNSGRVTGSYAMGAITGGGIQVGGLIGENDSTAIVEDSFWNTDTSGLTSSTGGTGLNAAQMHKMASFTNWSISNIGGSSTVWRIYEGHTGPLLRGFLAAYTLEGAPDLTVTYNGSAQFGNATTEIRNGKIMGVAATGRNVGFYTGYFSTQQGYDIVGGNLLITPKALTISGITAANKTYDGNTSATVSTANALLSGLVADDDLTLSATGTFADKNAGSNKTVSLVSSYTGADVGNYAITGQTSTTANIGRKALTISGITASDKTYDGNTSATVSTANAVMSGLVANDDLTLSATGTFADKNASSNKTVNLTSSYSGADLGNYLITGQASTTATIDQKALTVSGITASDKTYDGTTSVTVNTTGAVYTGLVANDVLSVSATGTFSDKNAGTNKIVNLTSSYSGADLGNYLITGQASTTANIGRKALTISGITASDKTYDGGTSATVSTANALLSGLVANDVLSVSATGTFADKNAGTNKTVSLVSSYSGADVGNYLIKGQTSTTASIGQKALTISGITASDKTYDGNTSATVNTAGAIYTGLVANDDLTLSATGTFADKNAGTNKTVSLNSSYSGADVANYLITGQESTMASISQKALSISGITASNKTYDGNTSAMVNTANAVYSGLVLNDVLIVSATGTFADKNAGTDKTVSLTSSYTGADVGNYNITGQTSTTANIAQKALTISGITAANKTYDGNTSATVSTANVVYDGLLSNDQLSVSATGTFADRNVGTNKTVSLVSTYTGADVGNYAITDQASTTATITPAPLTESTVLVSSVLSSLATPVFAAPTVTTPAVSAPSTGTVSTPSNTATTTTTTSTGGNTGAASTGKSESPASSGGTTGGASSSSSTGGNKDDGETSQPASSSQTSSTTQGNKSDNKSSPAPATVQTVNVAGTTVQKPAEQMINVPTSKGSTLVCK